MIDYSDLIGVPFKNRGRDKNTGLDCYGLVMEVYKKIGIQLPEYYADWNNAEKINGIIQQEVGTSLWKKSRWQSYTNSVCNGYKIWCAKRSCEPYGRICG